MPGLRFLVSCCYRGNTDVSRLPTLLPLLASTAFTIALSSYDERATAWDSQGDFSAEVSVRTPQGDWQSIPQNASGNRLPNRLGVTNPDSIVAVEIAIAPEFEAPELTGLDEVRIKYPDGVTRRHSVYPAVFLVFENSPGANRWTVYASRPSAVKRDQAGRVASIETISLLPKLLPATLVQMAGVAGVRGGMGRVYAGVSTTVGTSERLFLARIK